MILRVPIDQIVENESNPRTISTEDFDHLVTSLMDFPEMLEKRPVVCITTDEGLMPLGGNMRRLAIPVAMERLKILGTPEATKKYEFLRSGIPVQLADDWTAEQRDEFIIKDNLSYGRWNWDMVSNRWDMEQLDRWGLEVPDLKVKVQPTEDDFDQAPAENPVSIEGDLYELNGHRVLCGNSTHLADVQKLMDGQTANLCFTSPPYWVGKDYETQKNEKEIDEFIEQITLGIIQAMSKNEGRVVINTGTSSIHRIDKKRRVEILPLIDKWQSAFRNYGWLLRHLRIWAKRGQLPASITPKTDVVDQHNEYLGLFSANDEYAQVCTYWHPEGEQRGQERIKTPWAQQGLWDDIHGEKSAGGRHNAAFPVELPSRNIQLYSKVDELVYEPFGGSGTTLIACEQLGRKARLIELSPGYVDTTVRRWVSWMQLNNLQFKVTRNGINITTESWLYENN